MCGRYSNTGTRDDKLQRRMAELLGVARPDSELGFERFNIAPTQEVLAAVEDERGRRMEELRWGLVPDWTQGAKPRFQMINARAETVLERPAYRDLVQHGRHRCLVVADGWYEWQKPEDPKQPRKPVYFSLPAGEPFCFAGLWTHRTASCTILTCAANDLARPVHERMPVLLTDPAVWDAWLDPVLDGVAACELLAPLPSEQLTVRPANPLVNAVVNDGPGCLEPELTLL
jgi:putative SOS response-associated peptidase YedK